MRAALLDVVQVVACPAADPGAAALRAETRGPRALRRVADDVARVGGHQLRDGLAVAGDHVRVAVADAAEQLREITVGVGRRNRFAHSARPGSDITYIRGSWQ